MFIDQALHARHCSGKLGKAVNKTARNLCPYGVYR